MYEIKHICPHFSSVLHVGELNMYEIGRVSELRMSLNLSSEQKRTYEKFDLFSYVECITAQIFA